MTRRNSAARTFVPQAGCAALMLVLGGAGCSDSYSDEAFGVADLSALQEGATARERANKVPTQLDPLRGYVDDGVRSEYYSFGELKVGLNRARTAPEPVRVEPMYFFFNSEGRPLFSRPARETRDNTDWMKGGKTVLDPNPKDFCRGVGDDKNECTRLNNVEGAKKYPARRRDLWVDPNRGNVADYQRPIVDVLPGESAGRPLSYSGFWEVVEVIVPKDYEPDAIKQAETLQRAIDDGKFSVRRTSKVIDCPLLDERTYVTAGVADRSIPRPRIELWYRRKLAFCYLVHGWETLGTDNRELFFAGQDTERVQTFDVSPLRLGSGKAETTVISVPIGRAYEPIILTDNQSGDVPTVTRIAENVLTRGRPRHTQADPPGYTPLRWMHDFEVEGGSFQTPDGKNKVLTYEYGAGNIKSVGTLDLSQTRPRIDGATPVVRNLPLAGGLIPCSLPKNPVTVRGKNLDRCGNLAINPRDPADDKYVDPANDPVCKAAGLECNKDTCFCDLPYVGYGQACGASLARCSPEKDSLSETGSRCFPPWGGFCHLGCDGSNQRAMENEGKELKDQVDSRCRGILGYVCFRGLGLCLKTCDENVSDDKMQCKAETSIVNDKDMSMPPETKDINAGMTCQDFGITICTWPEGYSPPSPL